MSLLDPWRQARADIIASRPTYTPFYSPSDYSITIGNPDTGMVDQVPPDVASQIVARVDEVMDDGGIDLAQIDSGPDPDLGNRTAQPPSERDKFSDRRARSDARLSTRNASGSIALPSRSGRDALPSGDVRVVQKGPFGDLESYRVATTPGAAFIISDPNISSAIPVENFPMVGGFNAPVSQTGVKFFNIDNYEAQREQQQRDAKRGMGLTHPGPFAVTKGGEYPQTFDSYAQAADAMRSPVTYSSATGRAMAPAADPHSPSKMQSALNFLGFSTPGRTYGGGRYDKLGQDTWAPGYQEAMEAKNLGQNIFATLGLLGAPMTSAFGYGIGQSRTGMGGPYGRDAFGNYRFGASGPMGMRMSPAGILNTGYMPGIATNEFTGLYGLGTVGNTGMSVTPAMFDDVGYKGGTHGYGYGMKSDGTFGSLDAIDVNDPQGIAELSDIAETGFGGAYTDDSGVTTGTTATGDTFQASGVTGGVEDYFGDDGGGGGGDGGGKIICGELNRQGIMSEQIYRGDLAYAEKHVHNFTRAGYLLWARPLVKLMKMSKTITKIVTPPAMAWGKEMAKRSHDVGKGSWAGKIMLYTGSPICFIVGAILRMLPRYDLGE